MAKYKLRKTTLADSSVIEDILDTERTPNSAIPIDELNADYQEYLEWVAAGNTPDPAE